MHRLEETHSYRAGSIVEALYHHKRAQDRSRWTALAVVAAAALAALLVLVLLGTLRTHEVRTVTVASLGARAALAAGCGEEPAGSAARSQGMPSVGPLARWRVVADRIVPAPVTYAMIPAVDGMIADPAADAGELSGGQGDFWCRDGFGIPTVPLWQQPYRSAARVPAGWSASGGGGDAFRASQPWGKAPHAVMASPEWPRGVEFYPDTAWVRGWVTLRADGTMGFEFDGESHPTLGYADMVREAVARSRCYPAETREGERFNVRFPYICYFIPGARPTVMVPMIGGESPYGAVLSVSLEQ